MVKLDRRQSTTVLVVSVLRDGFTQQNLSAEFVSRSCNLMADSVESSTECRDSPGVSLIEKRVWCIGTRPSMICKRTHCKSLMYLLYKVHFIPHLGNS
jgi:hypothetical protein